jgi:hypothetical protein
MPLDGSNFEQQDEVLDLLRRARDLISQPGKWHQGDFYSRCRTKVCAHGAILDCGGIRSKAFLPATAILERALLQGWDDIAVYNDAPGRTQAEIVALFDRAIAKREGK